MGSPIGYRKSFRPPKNFAHASLPRAPITRRHNKSRVRERLRQPKECRDRIGTKRISNTDADCRSDSFRPSPPHGQDTRGCHPGARTLGDLTPSATHPLVGASALHGVSGLSSGSHLGPTLKPGKAVLTRGVSRRSGSVAYIHADASPTEVLASPSWHQNRCRSNIIENYLTSTQHLCRSDHTRREEAARTRR